MEMSRHLRVIRALAGMAVIGLAATSATAQVPPSRQSLAFYQDECVDPTWRSTIVMVDQDTLDQGNVELLDALLGRDGESGILGRGSMQAGEPFHVLIFRSSSNQGLFDYIFSGCAIGPKSLAAAPGRDPVDLANDRFIDQTIRLRRALSVLVATAPRKVPERADNDIRGMIQKMTKWLISDRSTTRLIIFADPYIRTNGEVPDDVTNQNFSRFDETSFAKTTVRFSGPDTSPRGSRRFDANLFKSYWSGLVGHGNGYLVSLNSTFGGGKTNRGGAPGNIPSFFANAKGLLSYNPPEITKRAAQARLNLLVRNNDTGNAEHDWLTVMRDRNDPIVFPLEGSMICDANAGSCTYSGKILRGVAHPSGPAVGDQVLIQVQGEGAFGAIYSGDDTTKAKFGMIFIRSSQ